MNLTEEHKDMIRLYERSPKDESRWAKVSRAVWPLTTGLPPDLFEVEGSVDAGGRMRLTANGEIVSQYLT